MGEKLEQQQEHLSNVVIMELNWILYPSQLLLNCFLGQVILDTHTWIPASMPMRKTGRRMTGHAVTSQNTVRPISSLARASA